MTPQLQDIKDRLSKIESDTAEARKMLEKVETEAKSAEPWRPIHNEPYYFVYHDGIRWLVRYETFVKTINSDSERVKAGNSFRTEAEALEVATQRQFLDEDRNAGNLAPDVEGWTYQNLIGELMVFKGYHCTGRRKFSTRELFNAFIEKWGGEKAVAERLSKGWR